MILLKKIIKKPILWIAVALLAIFIFLYITGFRITYAPNLKNDWDAISACAGWASVLLSFAAICAAIYVPYKVANDQNKISLFEKRYEVVVTVEKMFGEVDNIKRRMSIIFSKNSTKKLSFEIINKWRISISEVLKDVNGQILSISQFTLYATLDGRRPSFTRALNYNDAKDLYEVFNNELKKYDIIVETGIFGEDMKVNFTNDGTVTIIIDSKVDL